MVAALLDCEQDVDPSEAQEPPRMGWDVPEDEMVPFGLRPFVGLDQQVNSCAADELERLEVEHDAARSRGFDIVQCVLQRRGRGEVELPAEDQRHLVGLGAPSDRQLLGRQIWLGVVPENDLKPWLSTMRRALPYAAAGAGGRASEVAALGGAKRRRAAAASEVWAIEGDIHILHDI